MRKGKHPRQRFHPGSAVTDHPMIQQAFKTIGAILIATNGKDLEADFMMGDHDGNMKQFHVEVSEIQNG